MSTATSAVFAQLFTRDPLSRGSTRAAVINRIAAVLPAGETTLHRAGHAWATQPAERTEFLWSSDGGAVQAAIHPVLYPDDVHSLISLECPGDQVVVADAVRFVREVGELLSADLGHLTVLARRDTVLPTMYLTARDLRRWLPELWHGLLLGAPYVGLIGADRIRDAPAHLVERTGSGGYWMLLDPPETIGDIRREGLELEHRSRIHDHLGGDLFWRPDRRVFRTPSFVPSVGSMR